MAKPRKLTPQQLAKIMDEAARTWRPDGASTLLKATVLALANTQEPAAAVAHAMVHELISVGLGKRAVYALLMAFSEEWEDAAARRSMPGCAWERLHCDPLVIEFLAAWTAKTNKESSSTESDHAND